MLAALTVPPRDQDHERVLGIIYNLSPTQAAVLSCLSRGQVTTADELMDFSGVKSYVKIVVSRTRAKVKERGLDIKSKQRVGYWMEAEDKEKVEKAVDEFLSN